jgi:hypothetical protein
MKPIIMERVREYSTARSNPGQLIGPFFKSWNETRQKRKTAVLLLLLLYLVVEYRVCYGVRQILYYSNREKTVTFRKKEMREKEEKIST